MRAGILVTGKVVVQKGTRLDDEAVHNQDCEKRGVRGPAFRPARHCVDYMSQSPAMIPLKDVIPSRTFPAVNIGLIALNSIVFLFELSIPDASMEAFLRAYGVVPGDFWWPTVLTSMFIHAGWLHFLGNMLYLWIFGDNVEDRLGHARYVLFYLFCGTAAAAAHVHMNPGSMMPTIGASGAIAGVMGAYFVLYPQSRILALVPIIFFFRVMEVPAVVFLGIWFLMQFLSGASTNGVESSGVAFWAHVAGFLAGAGWVLIFRARRTSWA
jgi:membrane associated rhomboid family serine protease